MALLLLPRVGITKEPENSRQHVQPLRTEVEGNSPAPSQPQGAARIPLSQNGAVQLFPIWFALEGSLCPLG